MWAVFFSGSVYRMSSLLLYEDINSAEERSSIKDESKE